MNPMRSLLLAALGTSLMVCSPNSVHAQGSPEIIWQRVDHTSSVQGVAFSEDGGQVISGADYSDCSLRLWSTEDGAPGSEISLFPHGIQSVDHVPGTSSIAVGYIVSGYPPGGVSAVWDMETGQELFTAGGCHVDVSPDGMILASGGGGVNRYLALTRISDGVQLYSIYTGSYINDVVFSHDGSMVATAGSDNAVQFWDPITGQRSMVIEAHEDDVSALAFSSNDEFLATGAGGWDEPSDSSIKIWRVSSGELVRTFDGFDDWVYALDFAPDGNILLSSGRDGSQGRIRMWSLASGELMRWYEASAYDLAYSADGETFFYGSAFSEVVLAANPLVITSVDDFSPRPLFISAAPNPTRAGTKLSFNLSADVDVSLSIYDVVGRRVAALLDGPRGAGSNTVEWNGLDYSGARVAPGIYFARLDDGLQVSSSKLVIIH